MEVLRRSWFAILLIPAAAIAQVQNTVPGGNAAPSSSAGGGNWWWVVVLAVIVLALIWRAGARGRRRPPATRVP